MTRFRLALPGALYLACACGTVEDAPDIGGAGSTSSGGSSSGGAGSGGDAAGGSSSSGGETASGGSNTGGQDGSGGSETGGVPASGGSGAGGTESSGGTDGSGGTPPGSGGDASGGSTSTGVCGGDTPHGCYVPRSSNPNGCPPQIYEQSSFYPPPDEWEACSSPPFVPCVYDNPAGGEGECRCNLGQHWLCSY